MGRQLRRAQWGATLLAAAAMLCAVAIVNGGPIIYPDSLAYLLDAERMSQLRAPYATRPPFYGVAAWALHWRGQYGLALYAQALIVAHVLWLTLRAIPTPTGRALPGPGGFLLLVAGLVLLTPIAWHVAHLLPDVFIGVLTLSLFLLGFCAEGLGRGERAYLVVLAAASTSFHLTAPPIGAMIAAGVAVAWWFGRRFGRRLAIPGARPGLAALPVVLGVAGSLAFSAVVWHRATLTPNSPPHLLARLLADGPARAFLDARCPAAGYALCRYRDALPPTEDGFLWGMLPAMPEADGRAVKAEAGAVVAGTIRMFPLQVAGHMLANAARQLVTIRSETQFSPAEWAAFERGGSALAEAAAGSAQARGWFERPGLDGINALQAAVAALCLPAGVWFGVRCWRAGRAGPALLVGVVLAVLLANAFLSGAFGGVFGRYQGRVVWLLPFAAYVAFRGSGRTGGVRRSGASGVAGDVEVGGVDLGGAAGDEVGEEAG